MSPARTAIVALAALAPLPALAVPVTSVVSVTPLANRQLEVCWKAVPGAEMYWIEGSDGIENVVLPVAATDEVVCRDVNTFGLTACQAAVVTVRVGRTENGQLQFGKASAHFHFVNTEAFGAGERAADDFLSPPAICSPEDRYPALEGSTRRAPAELTVQDVSRPEDPTPRARISLKCVPPGSVTASVLQRYEIYESFLKPDGSTGTRTTKSDACPEGLVLNGGWGERTTVTAAAIYLDPGSKQYSHSTCTKPRTITYGGVLAPAVRLSVPPSESRTVTLEGALEGTGAAEVLVFVNPADAYRLDKPTATLEAPAGSAGGRPFKTTVELRPGFNRVIAIARRRQPGKSIFGEPQQLLLGWQPDGAVATSLADLPSFVMGGNVYLAGKARPWMPLRVALSREGKPLREATLRACSNGDFGTDLVVDDLARGEYTITAAAPARDTKPAAAVVHVKEVYPAPALSVEDGPGPFFVGGDRASLKVRVTPQAEASDPDARASGYRIEARLNGAPLQAGLPDEDSELTLTVAPLNPGANRLVLSAVHSATGQRSPPVELELIRATAPAAGAVDLEAAHSLVARGGQLYASGDFAGAAEAYSKLIETNPRSSTAHAYRAAMRIKLNDPATALEDATKAVELDPRNFEAYAYRTNQLFLQGKWEDAIADLDRSLQLSRKFPMAYHNRALARANTRRYDAAIADASRAIELDATLSYPYMVRGWAEFLKGDAASALLDTTKALELEPNQPQAMSVQAQAMAQLEDYDKAIEAFTRLIELDAANAPSYYNSRGWTAYKKGSFDEAIADASRSIEARATPQAFGTRAWGRYGKGDSAGAREDLAKAIASDPAYDGWELDQGLARFLEGDMAQAVSLWEKALQNDPNEWRVLTPLLEQARQRARKPRR